MLDQGQAQELWTLYTEHGRLHGAGLDIGGRVALQAFGAERQRKQRISRHVCANLRLWETEEGAEGHCLLVLYRHDGPGPGPATPFCVGDYHDRFVRADDEQGWLFAERRIAVAFQGERAR